MKKFSLFLLSSSLILGAGFSAPLFNKGEAEATVNGVNLTKSYYVGQSADFTNIKIDYKGTLYSPDYFSFTYPSGKRVTSKHVDLDENGKCTLYMYVMVGNEKVECYDTIDVLKNLCESKTGNSTAIYTYNSLFEENGIDIRLANNDEVKINKIIDISKSTFSTDSIVDFYFNPLQVGKPDAFTFYMTLTDIYDENNYIKVRMKSWSDMGTWADGNVYIDCKAPNQEYTTASNIIEDFYYAKRDQNTKHGWYISLISMCGRNSNGYSQNDKLQFYFDYNERKIVTNNPFAQPGVIYETDCITDFDNSRYYNLNKEKLWYGFTTGEVYVSFSAYDYNGSSANLFVTSLLGADFTEDFKDTQAPEIAIDFNGYKEDALPFAVTNKPYKLFSAYAYDTSDKDVPVETKVYYDYNGKKIITNSENGAFIPKKVGTYTIEYTAKDSYGNKVSKLVNVDAREDSEYAKFSFVMNPITKVGEKHKVIDGLVMENFNGKANVEVTLYDGTNTIKLDNDFVFIPEYSSHYEVTVKASDYVKEYAKTFELYVLANNKPVFDKDYSARKYYAKDVEYEIENIKARAFTSTGFDYIDSEVSYSYDGSSYIAINNNNVTFTEAGPITLKYVAKVNGQASEIYYSAEVLDIDYLSGLKMQNYFKVLTGDAYFEPSVLDMNICVTNNSVLEFINPIQVKNFVTTFTALELLNKFDCINLYLTDLHDSSITMKLTYEAFEKGTRFIINDDEKYTAFTSSDFSGDDATSFRLEYDSFDRSFMPATETSLFPKTDLSGKDFYGFTSDFAYLKIEFKGKGDNLGIHKLKINGQSFVDIDSDIFKPQVLVTKNSGNKDLNETVYIEHATFADVLSDGKLKCTMTVTLPKKSIDEETRYAVATDGTVLNASCNPHQDYEIICDEIGSYNVSFVCIDGAGKKTTYNYVFNAMDNVPPTIKASGMVTSAKLGDKVSIAKAKVEDNFSKATYFTVVEYPDTSMLYATDYFIASQVGKYKVYYYASDEDGNIAVAYYVVEVK